MGIAEIIGERSCSKGYIYRIEMSPDESAQLRGCMKCVHVLPELDHLCLPTRIMGRGKKHGAKYFYVPINLRPRQRNFLCVPPRTLWLKLKEKLVCIFVLDKHAHEE